MDVLKYAENDLKLHRKRCKVVSSGRIIALVPRDWCVGAPLRWQTSSAVSGQSPQDDMDERMCALCLSPAYMNIPDPWIKVSIKVIRKRSGQANCLPTCDYAVVGEDMGYTELMAAVSSLELQSSWSKAHHTYSHNQNIRNHKNVKKKYNDVVREAITRLYGSCIVPLHKPSTIHDQTCLPHSVNHNLHSASSIHESDTAFYIIQPYLDHSLHDLLHFSPCAVFENSTSKPLFLLYQILRLMVKCHEHGLSVGPLNPHELLVDENLWVHVTLPCVSSINWLCLSEEANVSSMENTMVLLPGRDLGPRDLSPLASLADLIQQWIHHDISNFQYLMCLNYVAGRRHDSPNHHPILPWVMDFTGHHSGFRDLTKSKYRLNKGDDQLDITYETDPLIGSLYPHHISDFLSDITYYVYEARRTPKRVLCTHVRRKWVPHEYPSSMIRLYSWTPDESIPAFFNDPGIFKSIHSDLADLELPEWCTSPEDFVDKHMACLESDQVSRQLNDWIDLTFGYKLSGVAAVKAKNVCLQLVNHHTRLTNHGVLQLFNHAHPARGRKDAYWNSALPFVDSQKQSSQDVCGKSEKALESIHAALQVFGEVVHTSEKDAVTETRSKSSLMGIRYNDERIYLPADFEPLAALEKMEKMHDFAYKNMYQVQPDVNIKLPPTRSAYRRLVNRDLNEFACYMIEVMMASKLRFLDRQATLRQRYDVIRNVLKHEWKDVPRTVRDAATVLLKLSQTANTVRDPCTPDPTPEELFVYDDPCLSAGALLNHVTTILPFPRCFNHFYNLISELKHLDHRIEILSKTTSGGSAVNGSDSIADLYREKVLAVNEILVPILPELDLEKIELILPYIIELFEDPNTTVSAAWLLFNHISRALGPKETAKYFLNSLCNLYGDENSTTKHLKLYERSFVRQLFIRLGLQIFLGHFATLFVEAAAAYRDFPPENTGHNKPVITHSLGGKTAKLSAASIESELQMQLIIDDIAKTKKAARLESVVETSESRPPQFDSESTDNLDMLTNTILIHDYDAQCSSDGEFVSLEGPDDKHGQDDSADEDVEKAVKSDSSDRSRDDDNVDSPGERESESTGRLSQHSVSLLVDACDRRTSISSMDDTEPSGPHEQPITGSGSPGEPITASGSNEEPITDSETTVDDSGDGNLPHTMVRSETEEFTQTLLESYAYRDECNICDVASETIKWLSRKLGPLLTAKFFSRNLLRMLALCYIGEEQIALHYDNDSCLPAGRYRVVGDRNARRVLDCLSYIASLYGEQVILLQYLPYIKDVIKTGSHKLKARGEAALIGCLALLQHIIPFLSDGAFMEILQPTIFDDILHPAIKLASSKRFTFPTGSRARQTMFHKAVDILYIIGVRIGFEFTRQIMTPVLQRLFASFDRVYGRSEKLSSETHDIPPPKDTVSDMIEDNVFCEIKKDLATNEYKISTPVSMDQITASLSWKYSLSPPVNDDRDEIDQNTASTKENIMKELRDTFTPELAHTAYIPFCRLAGGIYMEEKLSNHDLIRHLCTSHDEALSKRQVSPDECFSDEETESNGTLTSSNWFVDLKAEAEKSDLEVSGQFGRNVSLMSNKITVEEMTEKPVAPAASTTTVDRKTGSRNNHQNTSVDMSLIKNDGLELNKDRHLKGNWLAYWEHELGLNEKGTNFNFKQIKLQTYSGHSNSVRAITVMENENSFVTASKDKTVKLWSVQNTGDGQTRQQCRWTYQGHKKSVFAVTFLESARVAVSCDSSVHIWDPFVGMGIRQMEANSRTPAVCVLTPLPAPSTQVVTATTDGTLRFLDVRVANYAHEFKCTYGTAGYIKSVCVSPNTNWVAVGYSTGVISILDVRTGFFLKAWKGHEGEILQVKAFDDNRFVTSSFDQTMGMWNKEDGRVLNYLRGHTEAALCFSFYKSELISATVANRVGVHSAIDTPPCEFTCAKLRSDTFKGVLTTMAVLPLNRQLLLGADNGIVRLLC